MTGNTAKLRTSDEEWIELSIVMPCLNEERTLGACVDDALAFLDRTGTRGEIVVADNGSTDRSVEIAHAHGARVVSVATRGYGAALLAGIQQSKGRFVVMGDADQSYEFGALDAFLVELRSGAELVVGDRFRGGIEEGAMPWIHRYLGNPVLSHLGRRFFGAQIHDFHCGLRGFDREAMLGLGLRTTGMEFASEMIVRSCFAGLRIAEVPTRLRRDGRDRPPHLRTWRDGWRHLRFLLLYSPRWLFLYPGLMLLLASAACFSIGLSDLGQERSLRIALAGLGLGVVGAQMIQFALMSKIWGARLRLLPGDVRVTRFIEAFPLERALSVAFLAVVVSGGVLGIGWARQGIDAIDVIAIMGFTLAAQLASSSFLVAISTIPVESGEPAP